MLRSHQQVARRLSEVEEEDGKGEEGDAGWRGDGAAIVTCDVVRWDGEHDAERVERLEVEAGCWCACVL